MAMSKHYALCCEHKDLVVTKEKNPAFLTEQGRRAERMNAKYD